MIAPLCILLFILAAVFVVISLIDNTLRGLVWSRSIVWKMLREVRNKPLQWKPSGGRHYNAELNHKSGLIKITSGCLTIRSKENAWGDVGINLNSTQSSYFNNLHEKITNRAAEERAKAAVREIKEQELAASKAAFEAEKAKIIDDKKIKSVAGAGTF